MAAHKTPMNAALEQFECSACGAQQGEYCEAGGRRVPAHKARHEAMCGETFFGFPAMTDGHPMFCSRAANHRSRHHTPDGRLNWSKDLEVGPELKKILEGAA